MLSEFIEKQLKKAQYKILPDGSYFGEISGIRGVWSNAKTLESCREELKDVLEEWVLLKIRAGEDVSGFSFPSEKSSLLKYA
ncbi:MAG: type II toxin-antitoxin system HicB family antitoxin [Candidatus Parcubacteria bacterium]|nr:type II toxin-antitoxin system HicB family antitoxin [Candidatus Parcubacteria bacterium]